MCCEGILLFGKTFFGLSANYLYENYFVWKTLDCPKLKVYYKLE